MSLVAQTAPEGSQRFSPRRVAIAVGALGLATMLGMALGSLPAFTLGAQRISLATLGKATPATKSDQATLEDQARQAAVQQLAKAMLNKSIAEQAAAPKSVVPAQDMAVTTATGANAAAPTTEQTASLEAEDVERLANKAAEAIRNGDIASARLVLEHAVRAGDATALYALAETYDPRVLVKLKVQGMQGEPDMARHLYRRALDKGVEEARSRL